MNWLKGSVVALDTMYTLNHAYAGAVATTCLMLAMPINMCFDGTQFNTVDDRLIDSLYEVLDGILRELVENRRSPDRIVLDGFDKDTVSRVVRMYKIGEFKRGQMPQSIKIKKKSFGSGRRMPITNKWL